MWDYMYKRTFLPWPNQELYVSVTLQAIFCQDVLRRHRPVASCGSFSDLFDLWTGFGAQTASFHRFILVELRVFDAPNSGTDTKQSRPLNSTRSMQGRHIHREAWKSQGIGMVRENCFATTDLTQTITTCLICFYTSTVCDYWRILFNHGLHSRFFHV